MRTRIWAALAATVTMAIGAVGAWANGDDRKPVIAEMAPSDTWLLVGTDNWSRMVEAWHRSSVSGLTTDPRFTEMWSVLWDGLQSDATEGSPLPIEKMFPFKHLLEDAGVKIEELPLPSGAAGLAVYDRHEQPKEPEKPAANDDEMDFTPRAETVPGFVLTADFGARGAEVEESIQKAAEALAKRGEAEVRETAHLGVTVRTITMLKLEERWKAQREEEAIKIEKEFNKQGRDEGDDGRFNPGDWIRRRPMPAELRAIQAIHVARKDGVVVVCNELSTLEHSIERLDGQKVPSSSDREGYAAARDFLGDDPAVYIIWMTEVIAEDAAKKKDAEDAPRPLGLPSELLDISGVKGTQALAGGVYLDTERGPLEIRGAMLHPKLGGLFALFDKAAGPYEPPAFAPADADSAGVIYFRFDKLIPTVREALAKMPEEERPLQEAQLAQFEGLAQPVLASMGPAVHIIGTTSRPLSHESSQTTFAIQLRDPAPLTNILVGFGGGIGLKPRDFEGHQIFELDTRGMTAPMAVGVGSGFAFVGPTTAVENAMRAAGRPGGGLASKPAFREAAGQMKPGGVSYLYQDIRGTIEMALWTLKNPPAPIEFDFDTPDGVPRRKEVAPPEAPAWTKKVPDVEEWLKYIGDGVSEVHVTPRGIELVTWYRKPRP